MSTVNSSLKKLRELAPGLNKAADDASRIVQEVENLLTKELSLGINAEVGVSSVNKSPKKTEYTSLVHRRVGGKFRIAVVVEMETEFVNMNNFTDSSMELVSEMPWAECPRDVKLETFPKLPDLLQTLVKKAESTMEEVEKAQATVRAIIGSTPTGAEGNVAAGMIGDQKVPVQRPKKESRFD